MHLTFSRTTHPAHVSHHSPRFIARGGAGGVAEEQMEHRLIEDVSGEHVGWRHHVLYLSRVQDMLSTLHCKGGAAGGGRAEKQMPAQID